MLHWFCYEMDSVLRSNVEWENVALKKHFMGLWVVVVAEVQRKYSSVQFSSVAQSCPILCDPMNCSTPALPFPSLLNSMNLFGCSSLWRTLRELITG